LRSYAGPGGNTAHGRHGGEKRREEYSAGESGQIVYLEIPAGRFIVDYRKVEALLIFDLIRKEGKGATPKQQEEK
ncbi:MAG TPA: hypothetical protein VES69_00815, partial [Pyrinomonadaceae bacterium]|nr:hypothetical protein [Pyrinomonadaceae bacterium]